MNYTSFHANKLSIHDVRVQAQWRLFWVSLSLSHLEGQFKSVASKVRSRKCQGQDRTGLRLSWSCLLFSDSAISGLWHMFPFAKAIVLGSCVITPHNSHSFVPIIHMKTTRYINSLVVVACCGIRSAHGSLCSVWAMQQLHGLLYTATDMGRTL